MRKTIANFPLHIWLIPAFFLLHVLNEYFGLIHAPAYFFWAAIYLAIASLLWLISKWVTGSYHKGGLWTSCVLILYFFFGAAHDALKQLPIPSRFSSYSVVLFLVVLILLLLSVYFRKRSQPLYKGHQFFNLLWGVLVIIELVGVVNKQLSHRQWENDYALHQTPVLRALPPTPAAQQPDIFFVVFDEYASSSALKKYFHFDNSPTDSLLRANGFYVAAGAQSNYNSTPLSIGSCFNMQYFDRPMEGFASTTKTILQSWYGLNRSQVPKLLSQAGYAVYNFGVSDLEHVPVSTSRFNAAYETTPLYQETLSGRIDRDLLWLVQNNIPAIKQYFVRRYTRESAAFVARNLTNLRHTVAALNEQNDQPKFVFAHVIMPHEPFLLDAQGQLVIDEHKPIDPYDVNQYLQQLAYCNQWIDSLARTANQPFARPRVVVIEGDHGFRDQQLRQYRDKQFMNLNAWYFSDGNYAGVYDSISPVNTFPIVFNKYFNTSLPLRKDSTILLK